MLSQNRNYINFITYPQKGIGGARMSEVLLLWVIYKIINSITQNKL